MEKASPGALRTTRRALVLAVAAVLVLMALAAVAASQLLPMLERHPERVQGWLSERAGHPVRFDGLETDWTRRGPLLRLDGLRIGTDSEAVTIGEAEVLVAQYAGLLPGRSLTELRLRNLELTLARADDGRWHVRGLPGQDSGGDSFAALERLGELQVLGGRLTVDAPGLGLQATVPRIDVRLRVDGGQVRAATRAWMDADGAPLRASARFDRERSDGSLYVGMDDGDLDAWAPLLQVAGVAVQDGRGQAEAWAEVRDARIDAITGVVDLQQVVLRGAEGGEGKPLLAKFDRVSTRFDWARNSGGWRLDVPGLEAAGGGQQWRSEGISAQAGPDQALVADRLEAAPLLRVLALGAQLPPALREWLSRADANVVLAGVALAGRTGGPVQGRARVESVRFAPVGDRPGLDGLAGEMLVDGSGVLFEFDPQAPIRFDWPSGFGVVHEVSLRGKVAAWPQDGGWQVDTPALRLEGEGYGADLRGGLLFQGDGSRPRIDIAARLDETRVPVAKGFWVRYQMPEQAIGWLDAALVGGRVANGRAVVSGDLDDWPFDAGSAPGTGLFHAQADLEDATLKFQPDWPAAEALQGTVRFIGNGFDFRGQGRIAGVATDALEAGIEDFGRATLQVSTRTASGAREVASMLQQSPLSVETLAELALDGPMQGSFSMRLPLDGSDAGPDIAGVARLAGVDADMPLWDLSLQGLRGGLDFDEDGFHAPRLNASQGGQPVVVSLRAGSGHVRMEENTFEGELRASLDAGELLQRAPQLDWLGPHVDGRSTWSVGVHVPRGEGDDARLMLRSDLVGTRLDLPEPLRKPAQVPLQAGIRIPLPLGEGDIGVRLGQRMALRARAGDGPPAVRVLLGPGDAAEPDAGLVIEGRATELAAMEWAGLVAAGGTDDAHDDPGSGAGPGLALRHVDVQVDRLLLGGGGFGPVHLASEDGDGATQLRFSGEALSGTLALPQGNGGALTGHFERLHWQRPKLAAGAREASDAAPVAPADGPDPAMIPPVRLSVGDLRVDEARLGTATLLTRRIPGGMRVEQLEAQSPLHHVVVSGQWTGRGPDAVTRADMRVASGNFGQLLEGLGFHGHLRGGDGRLELSASWPASPAAFRAELLEGNLRLSVQDGHLVELEPGAGRLLGLLSVAELPRRLSLDFRDFFERGFAFNGIEGEIEVEAGRARSEGLVMDGPAAIIRVAGHTDLRARSYDQTVEVLPKSGNVLTAVGAIAGGPVGAAVGAVANAMLRKPLSGLGATVYRITGPWDEPQVEVVRRDPPPAAGNERGQDDD